MIQLIINADDLGLHPRIDEGILQGHRSGVVSSATVLATGRTAPAAVEKALAQGLSLGVHLCLTTHLTPAAPASTVRWLAPGGRFRRNWSELSMAWLGGLVPADEVGIELRAQIERARTLGVQIDHLDTHQHLHLLPGMTTVVEGLAAELNVPVRWPQERPTSHWVRHPRSALKTAIVGGLARM
ncbi:MAG: ChbG/HpnK family deacetylase, partial [Archangium sp.]|nr:ChbG/HpnK family deacetylase [Archangium sp.]